jgi:1,4-dihydroxy-2-naphthoate octaprenyltransferase
MLLYALGVSIARYLGVVVNWEIYFLGQIWVTLLQLSTQYLNEYFNSPADADNKNRTPLTGGSGVIGPGKLTRNTALAAALTCLAFLASATVLLMVNIDLTLLSIFIMVIAFAGALSYSTPPFKLESSGYGELLVSILVAFLVPLYAFNLQSGDVHRLVAMSTFPLTTLHLAMLLAFELPDYANDLKFDKRTVMVRLGWDKGMHLHNILIFTTYLLLVIAMLFGLPNFIWIPTILTFPIGCFQFWQMRKIASGAKPNWRLLTITAISLFGLMSYLMTFSYWLN